MNIFGRSARLICMSGFLFVFDQVCKYAARTHATFTAYIIDPWLGWEYLLNPGVAFSIPVPQMIVLPLTIVIVLGAIWFVSKKKKVEPHHIAGLSLVIFGALSNFVDRILFNATIDYIRIIASVINIADVMIVSGVVLLFVEGKKKT